MHPARGVGTWGPEILMPVGPTTPRTSRNSPFCKATSLRTRRRRLNQAAGSSMPCAPCRAESVRRCGRLHGSPPEFEPVPMANPLRTRFTAILIALSLASGHRRSGMFVAAWRRRASPESNPTEVPRRVRIAWLRGGVLAPLLRQVSPVPIGIGSLSSGAGATPSVS